MKSRSKLNNSAHSHSEPPSPRSPAEPRSRKRRLSKSRYVLGLQCPKLLWWSTHERGAPELEPSPQLQAIFERGHAVGALAREHRPGGTLIEFPHEQVEARVQATARALDRGDTLIYEASFVQNDIFVAVDILERTRAGAVALTEVKATLSVKPEHIPDLAVQAFVVEAAGFRVAQADIMHLNRECIAPDLSNLFARTDVTPEVRRGTLVVPETAAQMQSMLAGSLPHTEPGEQCERPHRCPFFERCHAGRPKHHVSTLYRLRTSAAEGLAARGIQTLDQVPTESLHRGPQLRQIDSVRTGRIVVEPGLRDALEAYPAPIAFLDFETIAPPVPVWTGCSPYRPVPVQLSCHVLHESRLVHHAWLADGAADPREAAARAVLAACAGTNTVMAYNASFERGVLLKLAADVPALGAELEALAERIDDLLPVVRDYVYHPEFGGSFSLKAVLPALVPELSFDDLPIGGGHHASFELERLLLKPAVDAATRDARRQALLDYCRLDTLGMVEVYRRLWALADATGYSKPIGPRTTAL
jgi:hypothetical protein